VDFDDAPNRSRETPLAAAQGAHDATEQGRRANSAPAHELVIQPVSDLDAPERNTATVILSSSDFSMSSASSTQATDASAGQEAPSLSGGPTAESQAAAWDVGQTALSNPHRMTLTGGNDELDLYSTSIPPGKDGWEVFAQGGNDKIIGSNIAYDLLHGEGGSDTLTGGWGLDTLDGGSNGATEIDYVNYAAETGLVNTYGVLVNMGTYDRSMGPQGIMVAKNTAVDTYAMVDVLTGIEGIIGTQRGDVITAEGRADAVFNFSGLGGSDGLIGGSLDDTLDGGYGSDTLTGGRGHDKIYGSYGIVDNQFDSLIGGEGDDLIVGGAEDYVNGGAGNNNLTGGHVIYDDAVTIDLIQQVAYHDGQWADSVKGVFWIKTGSSADNITANNTGTEVYAGDGADVIAGGLGNDTLEGEGGMIVSMAPQVTTRSMAATVTAGTTRSGIPTIPWVALT